MGRKRKQRKPTIEGDTSSLPSEVIYIILLKLSVKALLRFGCVCKSWRDVISKPQFAKSHFNESIRLDRLRLYDYSELRYHYFYSIGYESCEGSAEKVSFPGKKYWNVRVWCSCNGLVLLHVQDDTMYVLWNPSIRACRKFSSPTHIYHNYIPHGLCYDSSMDDYKVIFISTYDEFFVVFSFRGQCWTEPRKFPYLCFSGNAVIANGVLHWVALTPTVANVRRNLSLDSSSSSDNDSDNNSNTDILLYEHDSTRTYLIVFFDTVEGVFKEMPPPKCIKGGDIFSLTVMKGCLGLCCKTIDKEHAEVWTMKQYGERNSWTKFVVIPRWPGSSYLHQLTPLCATKNGEVVMTIDGISINGRSLAIYNPKTGKYRKLEPEKTRIPKVLLYVDSLILPTRTPQVKGKTKKEL
ncbi:F-box/kelch-repeat protein At3g23880-like [Cornus florida]|uniref:F-box/kelch-repeat protein At3g23880-like n=1 Tax=Cornus florida TaxID=4283 RepID=UPI002899FC34|nr:F-box/kelch-repeat protein At3g23880-like [Cornus florida]